MRILFLLFLLVVLAGCVPPHQEIEPRITPALKPVPISTPDIRLFEGRDSLKPTWQEWAIQNGFCWCERVETVYIMRGACKNEPVPSYLLSICR